MASLQLPRWKVVQNHKVNLADSEGRLAPLITSALNYWGSHQGIWVSVSVFLFMSWPSPSLKWDLKCPQKGNQSYIISSKILIQFCTQGENVTSNKLVNTESSFIQKKKQNLDGFQWCKPSNREWKREQESLFSPIAVDTVTKEVCGLHRGLRIAPEQMAYLF